MSATTTLREQLRRRRLFEQVQDGDGFQIAAEASLFPAAVAWPSWHRPAIEFDDWAQDFETGFERLSSEARIEGYMLDARYESLLETRGFASYDVARDDVDFMSLVKSARDKGVHFRWQFEQFFAEQGGEGARHVLTYVDDNSQSVLYDDRQFDALTKGLKVQSDGVTLQGHHINSVAGGLRADLTSIEHLHDPENIKLMTRAAHFSDHGYNWSNPTTGEAREVSDRYAMIVDENETIATGQVHERIIAGEIQLSLGVALAAGTLTVVIQLWRARRDRRPWEQKRGLILGTAVAAGAKAGILTFAMTKTRNFAALSPVATFAAKNVAELAEAVGLNVHSSVLQNLIGTAAGLQLVATLRHGFVFVKAVVEGESLGLAGRRFVEGFAGDMALNLGFVLAGVVLGHFVPDPTGIVLAVRLAIGVYRWISNTQSLRQCEGRKRELLYESTVQRLTPAGS